MTDDTDDLNHQSERIGDLTTTTTKSDSTMSICLRHSMLIILARCHMPHFVIHVRLEESASAWQRRREPSNGLVSQARTLKAKFQSNSEPE